MKIILSFFLVTTFVFYINGQESNTISWNPVVKVESMENDSNVIKNLNMMYPMAVFETSFILKGDTLVSIVTIDSSSNMRSVNILGEDEFYNFITLDGSTSYMKSNISDAIIDKTEDINDQYQVIYLGEKKIWTFNCDVNKIEVPQNNVTFTITTLKDYKFQSESFKLPFKGLEDKGLIIEFELDFGFAKVTQTAENFNQTTFDDSIFLISTENMGEINFLTQAELMSLMTKKIYGGEVSHENQTEAIEIEEGDGDYSELYLNMCDDGVMLYCDEEQLSLKPSFDKIYLLSLINSKNGSTFSSRSIDEINKIILNYDLIEKEELQSIENIILEIDSTIDGSTYLTFVQYLYKKNMLNTRNCKSILIDNLGQKGYRTKNVDHPEAIEFVNENIGWKEFLSSYVGIFDIDYKYTVSSEVDFFYEVTMIANTLLPDFNIKSNISKKELTFQKNNLIISYPLDSDYYLYSAEYDDEGNIKNMDSLQYDVDSFCDYGLLRILRQVGADFDLDMVFKIIVADDILSKYIYRYDDIGNNLFDGKLFLSIDKNTSSESFMTSIPFTKKNYNDERDKLSGIRSFYEGNPGIDYVPLYKKEKLYNILKSEPNTFGIDTSFDIDSWFTNCKNELIENTGSLLVSFPNLGVLISSSALNGVTYNKDGNSYQTIFPKLNQLLGSDFFPKDLILVINSIYADVTFSYLGKQYIVSSDIYKIEYVFLLKIISILKENNQYNEKQVYQSFENLYDVNNKKLFYLNHDKYNILSQEFDINLVKLRG